MPINVHQRRARIAAGKIIKELTIAPTEETVKKAMNTFSEHRQDMPDFLISRIMDSYHKAQGKIERKRERSA